MREKAHNNKDTQSLLKKGEDSVKSRFFSSMMLVMFLVVLLVPAQTGAAAGKELAAKPAVCLTPSMVELKSGMRKLWTDHVTWTRNYIVSAVAGAPDQQKVLDRLLKNQQDIGDAIKPYYGEEAGNKLAGLLREHILIAGKIVDAAKKGQQAEVDKLNKEWYRNADEIAQFLSSANPNWTNEELKKLLHTHLQLVTDAVTARIKQDWDGDILAFDKGINHILVLADTLSEGIIKQFPKKFQ